MIICVFPILIGNCRNYLFKHHSFYEGLLEAEKGIQNDYSTEEKIPEA